MRVELGTTRRSSCSGEEGEGESAKKEGKSVRVRRVRAIVRRSGDTASSVDEKKAMQDGKEGKRQGEKQRKEENAPWRTAATCYSGRERW
jgi:hypothetical protein